MKSELTIQTLDWRGRGSYVIRDARNCAVAEIGHIDRIHTDLENRAYAFLFRAAPDLLATLQEIADMADSRNLLEAREKARDAVERANRGLQD